MVKVINAKKDGQGDDLPLKPLTLLRMPSVERRVGIKQSQIYNLIRCGKFPKPIRLGERIVAWVERDVEAWIEGQITMSREA